MVVEPVPSALVVAVPSTWPVALIHVRRTCSFAPNPRTVTLTCVPAGPDVGVRERLGATAKGAASCLPLVAPRAMSW